MKFYYKNALEHILKNQKNKKIIIYKRDYLADVIYSNLKEMKVEVDYFISDKAFIEDTELPTKDVYDILYEERGSFFILGYMFEGQGDVYAQLTSIGLKNEEDFHLGNVGGHIDSYDAVDSLLGFTRTKNGIPGFKIFGSSSCKYKIIVLGGSTSDYSTGMMKSWPEKLYELLKDKYDVAIYLGAMGGYCVHQEMLQFLRDGLTFNPNMVISLDGYNDAAFKTSIKEHPFLHKYQYRFYEHIKKNSNPMAPDSLDMRNLSEIIHGVNYNVSDGENWISAIRIIRAVTNEFGIDYYSFFQPMIFTGKQVLDESVEHVNKLFEDYLQRDKDINNFYKSVKPFLDESRYVFDLTDIFDGQDDVYYDPCHYTEKGHEIIAKKIYDLIIDRIEEVCK